MSAYDGANNDTDDNKDGDRNTELDPGADALLRLLRWQEAGRVVVVGVTRTVGVCVRRLVSNMGERSLTRVNRRHVGL